MHSNIFYRAGSFIILLVLLCSCHKPASVIDVVSDAARCVVIADVRSIADTLHRADIEISPEKSPYPELRILASLRGYDLSSLAYVDYGGSLQAMVLSVEWPRLMLRSLSKVAHKVDSNGKYTVYEVNDIPASWFVDSPDFVWLIRSVPTAAEAEAKVDSILSLSAGDLCIWRHSVLALDSELRGYVAMDERFMIFDVNLDGAGLLAHARCVDSAGEEMNWLPQSTWTALGGDMAELTIDSSFALVCGNLRLREAIDEAPPLLRGFLPDSVPDYLASVGPINLSVNLDSVNAADLDRATIRLTCGAASPAAADSIARHLRADAAALLHARVEVSDSVVTLLSSDASPVIDGVSYSGYKFASKLYLSSSQIEDLFGYHLPDFSLFLDIRRTSADLRADFLLK